MVAKRDYLMASSINKEYDLMVALQKDLSGSVRRSMNTSAFLK